jgi:hypothetical protein
MGKARLRRALSAFLVLLSLSAAAEPALARVRMSFYPGRHGHAVARYHTYARGHRFRYGGRRSHRHVFVGRHPSTVRPNAEEGAAKAPTPGSGFKMEDGVLTYPAPARFQPQNLKHL